MTKKYIIVRMPVDVHDSLKEKQRNMNDMYKKITGKNANLPLTKIMKVSVRQPIYLHDNELINLFKNRNNKDRRIIL